MDKFLLFLHTLGIALEYSLDMGKTWDGVLHKCMPSNVTCSSYHGNSVYTSDQHGGWNRISIPLPYYTRYLGQYVNVM